LVILYPQAKIHCGIQEKMKWSGIARCGTKSFCVPCDASDVLVIDAETETKHWIRFGLWLDSE